MSTTGTQPPPGGPGKKPTSTTDVSWKIVLLVTLVMGGIVGVALPIAFHFQKASDSTSVLGVVLPIFTAVMGAALGTGVGNAAGSAGKKASDQKAAQSKQSLLAVREALQTAKPKVDGVFTVVKTNLPSPAGQANFMSAGADDTGAQPIAMSDMDVASAALERIQSLVDSALTSD